VEKQGQEGRVKSINCYGGGKDKAKPLFEKSLALYQTMKPQPLYPNWGQKQAEDGLAQCK